jgi:hypothetical protein
MPQKIKLIPILVGVAGAIVLVILNYISWLVLVFTNRGVQQGMRPDLRNLEALQTQGIYPAEIMLAAGIGGFLLLAFNYLLAPLAIGRVVRVFSKGAERLHGALLGISFFLLWSLGAVTSIPSEPMPIGSSWGAWLVVLLYGLSALSIYIGVVGVLPSTSRR